MLPYLLMMGAPSAAALLSIRRLGWIFIGVAITYWIMIGFRFEVGPDWDSYLRIYHLEKNQGFLQLTTDMEAGFGIVVWFASLTGGGIILVNLIAAGIFCFGIFKFAGKCFEPFLAIMIASPYLVTVVAMSGIRQAMAIGIIAYLFATWSDRTTVIRALLIILASLFHLSAIFLLVFVALGSRIGDAARVLASTIIVVVTIPLIVLSSARADIYADRYLGSAALTSEGALIHVAMVAIPALAYLITRGQWRSKFGPNPLMEGLALAAVALVPATFLSPVAADRMSLYFWTVVMFVGSGWPALIRVNSARIGYRLLVFFASFSLLLGWFYFANHSRSYLPYQSYLTLPEGVTPRPLR